MDAAETDGRSGSDGAGSSTSSGRQLLHFSFHKCLTVYYAKVMRRALYNPLRRTTPYQHLNSRVDLLPTACRDHRLVSVNNHFVDIDSFGDVRATRFVRDPRDMLVSGYLYHKRGAEPWTHVKDPTPDDWAVVNGVIPEAMPKGSSFSEYLSSAPLEEGLLAELEFRRRHYDSMAMWDLADPRVLVIRYDEVLGDHEAQFDRMLRHYGLPAWRRAVGRRASDKFSAARQVSKSAHVRDPRSGQWRDVLTPGVMKRFDERHGALIEMYGFER